mmetsp:Transcript_10266/g.8814  ORF Transcript_10266/g.8814 Transcript_10266/m.8814 type:complete len:142 (+) Transcript_10266:928-1353(+)
MLKKWVKELAKMNQFKLLYRGSKDGFDAATFHKKCDDVLGTLTIVKSNLNKIFGGYTDKSWKGSGSYVQSNDSWIFSITEKSYFKLKGSNNIYAILPSPGYGPTFGGGHDFYICNNCNTVNSNYSNFNHTYDGSKFSGKTQ